MSEQRTIKPLFTWRSAIASPTGPASPTTRHVLLTLSLHMSERGENAFPSTKTLAAETGLSERAVVTHLATAEETGWLVTRVRGKNGQGWRRHEYLPTTPKGTEPDSVPSEEALNVLPEGTERHDKKALNDVQSNSSMNSSGISAPVGADVRGDAAPHHAGHGKAKNQTPPCPHQEIIDSYHEILPMCPQVREWNDARKGYLRSRWREKPERQNLDWWRRFFGYVSQSPFLTGLAEGRDGKPPFVADLEWLIRPKNFAKVVEGRYQDRARRAA